MIEQVALTWVHLSDMHFGHGEHHARVERREILEALIEDLRSMSAHVPGIDQVIVSGDIAFTGGARREDEYAEARAFFDRLASSLGLDRDAVLLSPGNHDVDRSPALDDHDTRRWLDELRGGHSIEEAFASSADRQRLHARFGNYLQFSADYGPAFDQPGATATQGGAPLFWSTLVDARQDLRIRICGGNTALLSQDDDDHGRLQVGLSQLRETVQPDGGQDVTILVTHHPLDWCRDHDVLEPRVRRWVDLHLCGHVHRAESERYEHGSGGGVIRITAGALHEYDSGARRSNEAFTYSIGAVYADSGHDLWLRLWPRRWTRSSAGFRVDPEAVGDGQLYVDHRIASRRREAPRPAGRGGGTGAARPDGDGATELVWALSERSVRGIGARRTAYPLDMSIAELYERGLYIDTGLRDIAGGGEAGLGRLEDEAAGDRCVLLLGEPGSGKSVAAYALLRMIGRHRPVLAIRASDVIDLLDTDDGTSDLSLALRNPPSGDPAARPVIVVDGLDESLGEVSNTGDLLKGIVRLRADGPLIVTCRRREFEDRLARQSQDGIFDSIYELRDWRPEREFTEFVRRLVGLGMLESDAVLEAVSASSALRSLARRPLFARMLTFLSGGDVSAINDRVDLYSEYIDKLSATSDAALRNAGCAAVVPSRRVWVEAAWTIFANGLLHEDRFSLGAVASLLGGEHRWDSRCFARSLGQLCDQWRVAGRVWTRFVHYSFFEYLVACRYLDQVTEAIERGSTQALAEALILDLTPEIRHFLVGELRSAQVPGYTRALVAAYRETKELGHGEARVRTAGNLIAYLLSRVAPDAGRALRELLDAEPDMWLQQSLLWGLCHIGDDEGLGMFVRRSRASAEWRAWNRGYLMYYYGDLDRREDPPFIDHDRRRSWGRTRERSIDFMSSPGYERDIRPQRRFLDLYSLYDYAIWRDEELGRAEAEVTSKVLDGLWRGSGIDSELLLELQAMHAVVCRPWIEDSG
ncbi:metallophosphoesterase [Actinomadura coerulea]|uniref:metallophosphoesterase n=1 Tax=Actinomadura coerulea TaxID=46159 RepID=UPI003431BDE2